MEQKEKKPIDLSKLSKEEILEYIIPKIKGKDLFPKQTAEARKILSRARIVKK